MKKMVDKKQLHLTRETVRSLSEHDLVRAGGAAVAVSVAKDTVYLFSCDAVHGCKDMGLRGTISLFGRC
jgi:hypothetical protein